MARSALSGYLEEGGRTLAFIGEGEGGCTADDEFFRLLETGEEVESIPLPQWDGLHDHLTIYRFERKP
jgi:hypothetical protein